MQIQKDVWDYIEYNLFHHLQKQIVAKNLAKDCLHYTKEGQFGLKGVGYTIEAPESEVELMKKKVAEMEAQIEELKSYKKEAEVKMSENIAQMNDKFSKAISELTDVVIELTKTPSVAPTQPKQFKKMETLNLNEITLFYFCVVNFF